MKKIAPFIFALGIIISIIGGAKIPADNSTWPDSLPFAIVGAVVALVGLFFWRQSMERTRQVSRKAAIGGKDPLDYMRDIQAPLRDLSNDLRSLSGEQICARVDEILDGYVTPLVDSRKVLSDTFGLVHATEILVPLAYGERMLNRVWSAAADGYPAEVELVFPEVLQAFAEAAAHCQDS